MKPYSLVVFGATGFTGRLVCEHLVKNYHGQVKWAMAGRSQAKLESVRADLSKIDERARDVPIICADIADEGTLTDMTKSASTIISTVGPYARYGRPVVKACVNTQTHYCDLTGETPFVRRCIDEFHESAKANGTRIVHCCGYDSIPSEWGSLMCIDHMNNKHGVAPQEVYMLVGDSRAGVSGGTVDSGIGILGESSKVLQDLSHPYYLVPEKAAQNKATLPDKGDSVVPKYHRAAGTWSGPFIMSVVNSAIVRRANALLGYGESMTYTERVKASGWLAANVISGLHVSVGAFMLTASKLSIVRNALPQAGSGPDENTLKNGYWNHETYAIGQARDGKSDVIVRAKFGDLHGDPGYMSTSRMLLEAALCLALDQDRIAKDPYASKHAGGVLTPSSAMGLVLHKRLLDAGLYSEVATIQGA